MVVLYILTLGKFFLTVAPQMPGAEIARSVTLFSPCQMAGRGHYNVLRFDLQMGSLCLFVAGNLRLFMDICGWYAL